MAINKWVSAKNLKPARAPKRLAQTQRTMDAAYKFQKQGNVMQATLLYQQVLAAEPGNPFALYGLGFFALKRGDFQEAITLLSHSIEHGYDTLTTFTHLGVAYLALGQYENAIDIYQRAIRLEPKNPQHYSNLGAAFAKRQEYGKALEAVQTALAIQPDYLDALSNAGGIYVATDNEAKAREMFGKVLAQNPNHGEAREGLRFLDEHAERKG